MGFEVVVRPVVLPGIRPAPSQASPPTDDPTQGLATIHGSSGKFLDLQWSWSFSSGQSKPKEVKRKVDTVRVYQIGMAAASSSTRTAGASTRTADADGDINKDNYVDIEVAKKIWMKDGEVDIRYSYTPVKEAPNIEILERNKTVRPE